MKVQREQDDWIRRKKWRNKGTGGEEETEWEAVHSSSCKQYINAYSSSFHPKVSAVTLLQLTSEQGEVKSTVMPCYLELCPYTPSQSTAVDVL